MQWKELEGRWNQITSQVKAKLEDPTDDILSVVVPNPTDDADQQPGDPIAQKAVKAGPEEAYQADAKVLTTPPVR